LAGELPNIVSNIKIKFELFGEIFGTEKHEKIEMLKLNETLMFSINTTTTVGNVKRIMGNEAQIELKIPIVPLKGESIGIARNISGHWRLIGFGEII